jgi:hypothetical protein
MTGTEPMRKTVAAKNGTGVRGIVSPHFRGLSSLPVMPDPDSASPLLRKSEKSEIPYRSITG